MQVERWVVTTIVPQSACTIHAVPDSSAYVRRSSILVAGGEPFVEAAEGLFLRDLAFVHPDLHQEIVGLADRGAGLDAEVGHDLVAVEGRAHLRELLAAG